MDEEALSEQALQSASDTRFLLVRAGVRHATAEIFQAQFGTARAIVVADEHTFPIAGRDVCESLRRGQVAAETPFVFGSHVAANDQCARELEARLATTDAIPVAVGSGTLNDLVKLAAHRAHRPYLTVATAASMDGYTAYGASITFRGSKQTFDCPAPQAVLADLECIATAPPGMNAAGYADLLAKVAAGADWILADAAGVESLNPPVWRTVQERLHDWVAAPQGIANNDPECLRRLTYGLILSGFAMQAARTSRPASGAEHQFSHLWDMQHHTHNGYAPSHGFKVGIGTLASIALYEELFGRDLGQLDVARAVERWPTLGELQARIVAILGDGELAEKAASEMQAKYLTRNDLREQLTCIRAAWPELLPRLRSQLIPFRQVQAMLREAGCANEPEQIGIARERLRGSYEQAYFIRRRFTVLDMAARAGLLEPAVASLFSAGGVWASRDGNA